MLVLNAHWRAHQAGGPAVPGGPCKPTPARNASAAAQLGCQWRWGWGWAGAAAACPGPHVEQPEAWARPGAECVTVLPAPTYLLASSWRPFQFRPLEPTLDSRSDHGDRDRLRRPVIAREIGAVGGDGGSRTPNRSSDLNRVRTPSFGRNLAAWQIRLDWESGLGRAQRRASGGPAAVAAVHCHTITWSQRRVNTKRCFVLLEW